MRTTLILAPLLLSGTAVSAQPAPVQPPPPQLADPAAADRLADAMQALSKAFLSLPVGDVQAALEGRKATASDHRRTVKSETGLNDRELDAKIAAARPKIERSMAALNQALPTIAKSLHDADEAIARAVANMPDPNYPKR
jgi:hypothetical protein